MTTEQARKLNIKKGDYVAHFGCGDGSFLNDIKNSVSGICGLDKEHKLSKAREKLPQTRLVRKLDNYDVSVFDKVLFSYRDDFFKDKKDNLKYFKSWLSVYKDVLRSADHHATVVFEKIPYGDQIKKKTMEEFFESIFEKCGINKYWFVQSSKRDCFDVIFIVRKY